MHDLANVAAILLQKHPPLVEHPSLELALSCVSLPVVSVPAQLPIHSTSNERRNGPDDGVAHQHNVCLSLSCGTVSLLSTAVSVKMLAAMLSTPRESSSKTKAATSTSVQSSPSSILSPLWSLMTASSPARGTPSPAHSAIVHVYTCSPGSPVLQKQQTYHALPMVAVTTADNAFDDSNSRARGPFKPQKTSKGTSSWQLRQFAEATLGNGSLRKAVKLPEGEDINEWLAVNVVDFYNQINLLYGSITEFCSPQTCPEMKATDEFEYLWQDNEQFKRPTKMAAPEYIEHLMTWCQANIDNESLFPSRIGVPFPKSFTSLVRQMFKRLYRVYAHIYCHHYPVIIQLGLEPHLNTSFKHYVLFIDEHQLVTGKDFWGPLGDLVDSMLKSP